MASPGRRSLLFLTVLIVLTLSVRTTTVPLRRRRHERVQAGFRTNTKLVQFSGYNTYY